MTNIGTLYGPVTSTTNDVKKDITGIGRSWDMGDALSSPVGPYDDVKNRMFPKQDQDEDPDDPESIESIVGRLAFSSLQQPVNDPYAIKGTTPGNNVPYANTAAAVIVSSS